MKNRDVVSSVIWMVFGGIFSVGALPLGLKKKDVPGPRFLPFFTRLDLIVVSFYVLIPALRQREKTAGIALFPERGSLRKTLVILGTLFAFGLAMKYLGYLLATFLFMLFITRLMKPKGWLTTALLAFVAATFSYALFAVLLEVNLPQGLLGF